MAMTVHGADAGRAVLILCGGRSFFFLINLGLETRLNSRNHMK